MTLDISTILSEDLEVLAWAEKFPNIAEAIFLHEEAIDHYAGRQRREDGTVKPAHGESVVRSGIGAHGTVVRGHVLRDSGKTESLDRWMVEDDPKLLSARLQEEIRRAKLGTIRQEKPAASGLWTPKAPVGSMLVYQTDRVWYFGSGMGIVPGPSADLIRLVGQVYLVALAAPAWSVGLPELAQDLSYVGGAERLWHVRWEDPDDPLTRLVLTTRNGVSWSGIQSWTTRAGKEKELSVHHQEFNQALSWAAGARGALFQASRDSGSGP